MSLKIALAGNPNSGKTTAFNRITGAMQKVGNWGGVTVEIKEAEKTIDGEKVVFVDLPGTYSLSAFSEEERVAREYLIEQKPDVVIDVVDATNLDRHLYLAVQLMELGIRPVIALNMWDEVAKRGIAIEIDRLRRLLGLRIVATTARTGKGIDELLREAMEQARAPRKEHAPLRIPLPHEIASAVDRLEKLIGKSISTTYPSRWVACKLLEHDDEIEKLVREQPEGDAVIRMRDTAEMEISELLGDDPGNMIAEARYGYIAGLLREVVSQSRRNAVEVSDRIDSVLTHRFWAFPIFIAFMWLLFQATFKIGEYPMGWIEAGVEWLMTTTQNLMPASVIRDLIVDGVIAGVGGVIVFLPNILILFFGISIMEDSGYMARAAFIMDRLMHRIGLHGKSFIPMLMGLGCSVPAIMATRTLESRNDRIKTILLTPLVSCSARLPVFVLFAGALFPKHAGNVVFLFQVVLGFAAFVGMALLFKVTLFRGGEEHPFVMELPPYRVPTGKSVLIHMWWKARHYLKKMGGVVLVFSVILWWAGQYPKAPEIEARYEKKIEAVRHVGNVSLDEKDDRVASLESAMNAEVMRQTYIGRIGRVLEPVVRPFGTDWRGAVSLVTGFVAKEVVVGSMGVLYAVGDEVDEENDALRDELKHHFTPLTAVAFMLFVLLYTPCVVALVTLVRELKDRRWSIFSVVYQVVLAWTAATVVYQTGRLLGLG
ncbi:MAG: ferrous iron transport protein B [Chitinivibrionales bacterium]|nr:ferrous iron transport protein B [Chitinivibrionales bacterium]MBD3358998.1 ferrous iron transport protein B [Chitinivibrionales bacterium]